MFVLTIDQRGSRTHGDKVPHLLEVLDGVAAAVRFERSVGDEIQGVIEDPAAVVEVVARVLREREWYVGIGVGSVELPLPASSREGAGDAFIAARDAVDAAKKTGERVPLTVRSTLDSDWVKAAEAILVLVGDVVRRRSAAEWRVLDALNDAPGSAQKDIAIRLAITPQAVSKSIVRSGRQEEINGRRAAALVLGQAAAAQKVSAGR
ncbi:hypothetical protein MB46_03665 [Arthrobacter alpinus]|uniref:MarR family transcriptional regulator n=1 Tax=Arthrobacter alpinus TaxID=656366 RepID=UPI0005CA832B|nr:helix-turn-helix domain-containing protein [Arthrobacter alpinus]ALV44742.1 hypothetical protein MB46_03665 [Arthrobacter alpinus]